MSFHDLIQYTLATLVALDCQPKLLAETFARVERNEVDGGLVMETRFMAVADKGQLRWVHIYSQKINVLTLFFFPHHRWQLPVYCMELVVFSAQPIVAMLDTVCLIPMSCAETTEQFMTQPLTKTTHNCYKPPIPPNGLNNVVQDRIFLFVHKMMTK
jgi:hypothetical protein